MRTQPVLFSLALLLPAFGAANPAAAQSARMNFFVTHEGLGNGADLGGLAGADEHCFLTAYQVGAGDLRWFAYLSVPESDEGPQVNARDRIGTGPWYNYRGELIAESLEQLHSEESLLTKETALTQRGAVVSGRGDTPNRHDILTGSQPDGTAFPPGEDTTCDGWTSSGAGSAWVGHHDRVGLGPQGSSWNSAHGTQGCGQEDLEATGGAGLFYCFSID